MRAREFIIEYDRGMTLKSWEQKLTARMASDQSAPETIDEIMEMIESADPTRNKVYAQWIVKRYVAGDFAADDLDQVNLRLTDYDSVKRVLTTGKDINQLTYAQLPDLIQAGKAQKSAPKFEIIPDTEVLYNGPDGQLAIPKTETASRALGSGTAWCTAYTDRDTLFDHYNSTGKLYTWRAKNGDKFQFFWGDEIQFMNSANKPMSPKDMHFYRSINPPTKKLFAKYEDEFLKNSNPDKMFKLVVALLKSEVKWEEAISLSLTSAELAYQYVINVLKYRRFPEGEALFAKDPEYACRYGREVIGGEWPEGEPAIATSAKYSYEYAHRALRNKPFPAGEPAIAKEAEFSYYYAKMLDKPFPIGEKAIATSAQYSFYYADTVLNGERFPAGEAIIAKDSDHALNYVRSVIKEEWPEGEAAIAADPSGAVTYARFYRQREWPEAEAVIATDPYASTTYAIEVLKRRFPAGEPEIAKNKYMKKQYTEFFGIKLQATRKKSIEKT